MKLIIEHLSKRFEKKEVLRDITFSFEAGKIYGLLGRNGAGKTTLFNCLNRDLRTDGGSFLLEENGARRELAAEDIGYVLSTPAVPEFLTAREFLNFLSRSMPAPFQSAGHWTNTLTKSALRRRTGTS